MECELVHTTAQPDRPPLMERLEDSFPQKNCQTLSSLSSSKAADGETGRYRVSAVSHCSRH